MIQKWVCDYKNTILYTLHINLIWENRVSDSNISMIYLMIWSNNYLNISLLRSEYKYMNNISKSSLTLISFFNSFFQLPMKQCQSCGIPLSKDPSGKWWWTQKDGSISSVYCSLCYRDGNFCYTGNNISEFQDIVDNNMQKDGYGWLMRKLTRRQIPHLDRRKSS